MPTPTDSRFCLRTLAFLLLTVVGCGGQKTYPVEGRVVFKEDGSPLWGGFVQFELKDEEAPSVVARGAIQEDGSFRLQTYRDNDGALEGVHRVLITPPLTGGDFERGNVPQVIHPRYKSYQTSKLEFTVTRDRANNNFRIEIEKPPRR
jgi:hypothetical protein